jgi:hypothetical protein
MPMLMDPGIRIVLCKTSKFLPCLILVLSFLSLLACQGLDGEGPYVAAKVISAKEAYPVALAEAHNWNLDAHLTNMEADVRRAGDSRPLTIIFD